MYVSDLNFQMSKKSRCLRMLEGKPPSRNLVEEMHRTFPKTVMHSTLCMKQIISNCIYRFSLEQINRILDETYRNKYT